MFKSRKDKKEAKRQIYEFFTTTDLINNRFHNFVMDTINRQIRKKYKKEKKKIDNYIIDLLTKMTEDLTIVNDEIIIMKKLPSLPLNIKDEKLNNTIEDIMKSLSESFLEIKKDFSQDIINIDTKIEDLKKDRSDRVIKFNNKMMKVKNVIHSEDEK
ncbi:MAG: hypothetical protein ACTSRG_21900 [Candidatus Helarchaeota archaeon]